MICFIFLIISRSHKNTLVNKMFCKIIDYNKLAILNKLTTKNFIHGPRNSWLFMTFTFKNAIPWLIYC